MSVNDSKKNIAIPLAERFILILSAACTVVALSWVLWFCHYGIEFRDEGFCLVWISDPFKYNLSVTQFGFVYHPLYELLDGNIAALRQTNILITYFLAWGLSNVFLRTIFGEQSLEPSPRLIISAAISTSALVFLLRWMPTPSYNWLALQGLLITSIGILLAEKQISNRSILGYLIIGVGGWLTFMGKPTTAGALSLFVSVYLLGAGKTNIRLLAISLLTAVGLLVASGFIIDGSIIQFFTRYKECLELEALIDYGLDFNKLIRLEDFWLYPISKVFLVSSTGFFCIAAYFSQAKTKTLRHVGVVLIAFLALLTLAIVFGFIHTSLSNFGVGGWYRGLLLWSAPFSAILLSIAIFRLKGLRHITRDKWALAFLFLLLPYAFALGTNANYWHLSAYAGIFWVLSGFIFLSPVTTNQKLTSILLTLGLAVQMLSIALIQTGLEGPYGQAYQLQENSFKIKIGNPSSTLILSNSSGHFFTEVNNLVNQVHFKKGTPVIDLTGESTTILYAMGASSTGQAYIIGGLPGSNKLAVEMLKRATCEELAQAWLMTEPERPERISSKVLSSFGANITTDYEIVGTLNPDPDAGGYKQLLKPSRAFSVAINACAKIRVTK